MTHSPIIRFEQADIGRARIERLRDHVAVTIAEKCDRVDAEFSDDDHIRLEQAVSDELFEHILEFGDSPRTDEGAREWFGRIEDDFADPESTSAHSGVSLMLGTLATRDDAPKAAWRLSNAILAEKYDR